MRHRLTRTRKSFTCSVCGPTHVYGRGDGSFRCGTKHDSDCARRAKTEAGHARSARRTAKYRSTNRELCLARTRAWNDANPERKAELYAAWYAENKNSVLARNAVRRALEHGDAVELIDRVAVYERDRGICGICKRKVVWSDFQVDHIIPLSRGGLHAMKNAQASHARCNRRKHAKIPAITLP